MFMDIREVRWPQGSDGAVAASLYRGHLVVFLAFAILMNPTRSLFYCYIFL